LKTLTQFIDQGILFKRFEEIEEFINVNKFTEKLDNEIRVYYVGKLIEKEEFKRSIPILKDISTRNIDLSTTEGIAGHLEKTLKDMVKAKIKNPCNIL